jgi:hypothetical protein
MTCSNITYDFGVVSRYMHAPHQPHFDVYFHILHYLKEDPGRGLLFKPYVNFSVTGFSDANWAGSYSDKQSTFGCCTFVGYNLVI